MMENGNGMAVNEDRAHFTMWSMLAAPLIAGNDLHKMLKETDEILTNKEVIVVNQDSPGIQSFKYADENDMEIWFKPLKDDEWAVVFLNRKDTSQRIDFNRETFCYRRFLNDILVLKDKKRHNRVFSWGAFFLNKNGPGEQVFIFLRREEEKAGKQKVNKHVYRRKVKQINCT